MSEQSGNPQNLEARVVQLESLHAHYQRTIEDLDQVVLAQQNRLDALERAVAALREGYNELISGGREERRPEDEKPPHY